MAFLLAMAVAGLFFVLRPDSRVAGARERTFGVSVEDGKMVHRALRVGEEDRLTPVVADEPAQMKPRGFDIESEAGPRESDVGAFGVGPAGEFGIEDSRPGEEPGALLVGSR